MEALIKDYGLEEHLLVRYEPEDVAEHGIPDDALLLKEEILTEDEGELDLEEDSDRGQVAGDSNTVFKMVVAADCDEIDIKEETWSDIEWVLEENASLMQPKDEEANSTPERSAARPTSPPEINTKDGVISFQSKSERTLQRPLPDHQPTIDDGAPLFACSQCQYKTRIIDNLHMHSVMHRKKEVEECRTAELEYEMKGEIFHCKLCKFKSKVEWTVQRHLLGHRFMVKKDGLKCKEKVKRELSEGGQRSFGCDQCSYKGRYKYNLKVHSGVHRRKGEVDLHRLAEQSTEWRNDSENGGGERREEVNPHEITDGSEKDKSEVDLRKAQECSYAAKQAEYLKRHTLVREYRSEFDLYQCHECSYAAKRADVLRTHMLIHKATSEVDLYKCEKCSFATKHARSLKRHLLLHKAKSEVNLYKCKKCSYATRESGNLRKHRLIHKTVSEVDLHKCKTCSFATKHASYLKKHVFIHKAKSEVDLYKCHECSYAAKRASYLKRHMLIHKANSEVDLHKCEKCLYTAKHAGNLRKHMLIHKVNSEVDLQKCEKRSFAT